MILTTKVQAFVSLISSRA